MEREPATLGRAWLGLGLAFVLLAPTFAATTSHGEETHRFTVALDPLPEDLVPGDRYHQATVLTVQRTLGHVVVSAPDAGWAKRIEAREEVTFAEPDPLAIEALHTPNDELYTQQYGPAQIRADQAWDITVGTTNVTICVADTGLRLSHEDIDHDRVLATIDVVNGGEEVTDGDGHGTWTAGIAAASIDNTHGIAGISQAGLLVAKVLDDSGNGRASWVADGITWCADQGADVINLSLGTARDLQTIHDAVGYAHDQGSLVVASAGNDGRCTDCISYPAAYPEAVAVTGTTGTEHRWTGSSTGPQAELAAPAEDVAGPYGTDDDRYVALDGTSAAAPHVSGAAALLFSVRPELSAQEVRGLLNATARDLGDPGRDPVFGHGIPNLTAALDVFLPTSPLNVTAEPGPAPWQITVAWNPPADDGGRPLESYLIERKDGPRDWQTLAETPANRTSLVDDTVMMDLPESHRYRVTAISQTGPGEASQPACTTTQAWHALEDTLCDGIRAPAHAGVPYG